MTLRVCHVMTADLWAGAEVQLATTMSYLAGQPDVEVTAVLFNEGRLAAELRRVGVGVVVVDERREGGAAIVRRLVEHFRAHRVEIVHTHRYKDTVLGGLAATIAGVPGLVRTVHGLPEPMAPWPRVKSSAFDLASRAMLWPAGDSVVAVSESVAGALRRSGYRPSRVKTIHNGIDLAKVRCTRTPQDVRHELGIPQQAFLVGTAGRLTRVKGHSSLVAALAGIRRARPDARCLIVGGGPLADELARQAATLGVSDACVFTGARNDVLDLIAAMDVFVLPSLHEGIPMALLEAMALERPLVATRVGGVPEVVEHGATGLLVPAGDPHALAAACLELGARPDAARELGKRARQAVQSRFSHEIAGAALVTLYRRIAAARRERRPGVGALDLGLALPRAVAGALRRRVQRAVLRRRMLAVRRDPSRLIAALASARRILIVCHGNIIRSPFAAALVAHALGPTRPHLAISSAGLDAVPGRPAHSHAVAAAEACEIDLRGHAATPLTREQVAASDVIFVMELLQLAAIGRRFPQARGKTFLLSCLAPEEPLEVRDPVEGDAPVFHACYDHISTAVRPIVRALAAVQPS